MKQLTVVAEYKSDTLSHMSYLLGRSHVAIENMCMCITGTKAIIHFGVKDTTKARAVLEANGFRCFDAQNLVLKLKNIPEELNKLVQLLNTNKIEHENPNLLSQEDAYAIYALKVGQPTKATRILAPYLGVGTTMETEMMMIN